MYIEFENADSSEISIDWSNDDIGIAYHANGVNSVTMYKDSASTDANWIPVWKNAIKATSISGLIASKAFITSIKVAIKAEGFDALIDGKTVCAITECYQNFDACGVCGGDGSTCQYSLCNEFPVSDNEFNSCPFNYFGEGEVSGIIVFLSLFPVILIPLCFCAFLQHQKKKLETERIIQELQDAEEFQPTQQEPTLQHLYPQFDNNNCYLVEGPNGEQYVVTGPIDQDLSY